MLAIGPGGIVMRCEQTTCVCRCSERVCGCVCSLCKAKNEAINEKNLTAAKQVGKYIQIYVSFLLHVKNNSKIQENSEDFFHFGYACF